jgi:hypothetical protein
VGGDFEDHEPCTQPDRSDSSSASASSLFTGVAAVCQTVTRLASVDGAAVAVFAPSRSRELVYATDAVAQQIDDLQFIVGEGPCLDAYRLNLPQWCPRLDTHRQLHRWPAFCEGVLELGAQAVFALPVPGPNGAMGVLELYRRTTGLLKPGQRESAAVCAMAVGETLQANWTDHVTAAMDAGAAIAADSDARDTGQSQFSRAGVYIASGMVAVQLGVSADEGLDLLRAHTYAHGRAINEVAADIIARRLSLRGFRDDPKEQ